MGIGRQAFNPVEFSGLEKFEDYTSRDKTTKQQLSEKQILDFSGQQLGVCEVKMIAEFKVGPIFTVFDRQHGATTQIRVNQTSKVRCIFSAYMGGECGPNKR
jgi:hypothetical protein